jgi:predicted 3-demethylubiquinone-9 3-methyltransferase (glyoxalase superfamily)
MSKIQHCLWFAKEAEDAAKFYVSIFKKDARLGPITRYTGAGTEVHGMPEGMVMTAEWEIFGEKYIGINGGPIFKHSEAFSIQLLCETQEEIDSYWKALTDGGEESQCGWLKDRFGVSWQVSPRILGEMMKDRDIARVKRVTDAFLQMKKYDIAELKRAYEGGR